MPASPRPTFRILALALLAAVLLSACGGPVEDTRPGQPVKSRQDAFKAMLRSFEPMGVMLRTNTYNAEKFAALANDLIALRDAPWPLFAPDTHYPPTKAKATVWSQAALFEKERQAFLAALDKLHATAQGRQREQVEPAYFDVYERCESCHRQFKER